MYLSLNLLYSLIISLMFTIIDKFYPGLYVSHWNINISNINFLDFLKFQMLKNVNSLPFPLPLSFSSHCSNAKCQRYQRELHPDFAH